MWSFVAVGYLMAAYFYNDYAPPYAGIANTVLSYICLSCVDFIGDRAGTFGYALLVFAPINAVIYGAVGFGLGRLLFPRARSRKGF